MKKKLIYQVILCFLPLLVHSQDWGGMRPNGFRDHWSVSLSGGLTSYFGDLSFHDTDLPGKISSESGPVAGIRITKHASSLLSISGELFYGTIQGGNNKNISFRTRLAEYNLQARLDIIKLVSGLKSPKFGMEAFAGIGQFLFRATTYELGEGENKTTIHQSSVPEFVYFAGGGIHYHLGQRVAINADFSLHHGQNDKLDNLMKNNNYDYYTYLSAGITYYFPGFKKAPLRNKARIASSSIRLN